MTPPDPDPNPEGATTPPVARQCNDCGCQLPPQWPRPLCGRCSLEGALDLDEELLALDGSPLSAGRIIDGRFNLQEVVGRGGMGVVWLAHDQELGEPVALKFLPAELQFDSSALAELRMETARTRRLSHPNIIRVFDFHNSTAVGAYLSMEHVNGISLQRLRSDQPGQRFAWKTLQPLILQLCDALQYAHKEQVIHRDLKPGNLIVNQQGILKLADFGVAALVADSTLRISLSTRHTGSLQYMSPQQLSGLTPRPTDDFYSLGAALYDLLSGHPPFFQGDIQFQLRETMPQPLGRRLRQLGVAHDVPPHIAALVMSCLAKRPERRPRSAQAIARWIGPDLRVRGIRSRFRGWMNRLRSFSRPGGQS